MGFDGEDGPVPLPPRPSHKPKHGGGFDTIIDEESSGNPFGRESNTEKLLLAREKERELRDLTKGTIDNLRVFEKSIATRQNRAGVIRDINSIKASKRTSDMLQDNSNKLSLEDGNKKKLNIFDQSDANALKNEALLRLGY